MTVLFLDDAEARWEVARAALETNPGGAMWVTTAGDAIKAIQDNFFDCVFLDHDLGGEVYVESGREDCGMEVVRWIIENRPQIDMIIVHTWNVPAGRNMVAYLMAAGYRTEYRPFGT